jgi:SAM-dependent methyltransferase
MAIKSGGGGYRSRESSEAFWRIFGDGDAYISIGGGPNRPDARLVNLNIARLPNVDVLGDAHVLPLRSESIDGLYCEAVLEHLADPPLAVREMSRTLRPGGRIFAVTPFLQAYHGYPDHYQNFTLSGHRRLFEAAGFEIESAGSCNGPVTMICDLVAEAIAALPPLPRRTLRPLWRVAGAGLRPLDARLLGRPGVHTLASTTFVLARKPGAP